MTSTPKTTNTRASGRMVLMDGSLPGLVALAEAVERGEPTTTDAVFCSPFGALQAGQIEAVERQAEAFAIESNDGGELAGLGGQINRTLVVSGELALARGHGEVVWPAMAGDIAGGSDRSDEGIEAEAVLLTRAALAARLVSVDAEAAGVVELRINAVFADLRDDDLADLAVDLGVDVTSCWWWGQPGEAARAAWSRWSGPLRRAGWLGADDPAGVSPGREVAGGAGGAATLGT